MITLDQYVGPHSKSPSWTKAMKADAFKFLTICAGLYTEMVAAGVVFPINPKTGTCVSGSTFGGFRPPECPQGSPKSSHKEGTGVDWYDPSGVIDDWCISHIARLAHHGIYIEHPSKTQGWSHWTTRRPGSGNRAFYP